MQQHNELKPEQQPQLTPEQAERNRQYAIIETTNGRSSATNLSSSESCNTSIEGEPVNHLVSKRMIKQQQMHCTERGAHLLPQVRAKVLNG
jgi:hypothetical protein